MKYLLMICGDEKTGAEPPEDTGPATESWVDEMTRRGIRLDGDRLRTSEDTVSVRVRADERLVTDGPYSESKEQIAGYDVIECADLDQAIEVASKHPVAGFGVVEVWPFWEE